MANYIGVRCPVCNKKFTEADDIVVCPVCGAPHHRSCYAEQNQCAFAADHLSGKEWSDPAGQVFSDDVSSSGGKTCARCKGENAPDAIFCHNCGYPMTLPENQGAGGTQHIGEAPYQWGFPGVGMQVDAISMVYGGLNPDDEIEGESVKEVAKYIGSGSAYYLPRFRMMSEHGRSFIPNLSAFLFGFFYYFYRRMYAVGGLLLAITLVSLIPDYLYNMKVLLPTVLEQMEAARPGFLQYFGITVAAAVDQATADHYLWLASVAQTVRLVVILIFSLFANRAYYSKAISAVRTLRTQRTEATSEDEYYGTLSRAGGTNKAFVAALASACLLAHFVIFYAVLYTG